MSPRNSSGDHGADLTVACFDLGVTDFPLYEPDEVPSTSVILDVREDDEWTAGHAPGALHIPLADLPYKLGELPDDVELAIICRSGGRSIRAAQWLEQNGYDIGHVEGGMNRWARLGLPMVAGAAADGAAGAAEPIVL